MDTGIIDIEYIRKYIHFSDDRERCIKESALNEDGERVLRIVNGLMRNYEKYGESYCPCKIEKIPENICPCVEYRKTNNCICGLYKGK